jgi:Fe2+ or Zn2+ uptake regulation protein
MNISEIIKKAGLRATPQRKMLYEIMTELGHASIDEIITRIQQQNPEITTSTVYRILDSFCTAGLLSKINHTSGKNYYDITLSEHHHIFKDEEVIDYIDPELTEMIKNHLKDEPFKELDIKKISINIITTIKK